MPRGNAVRGEETVRDKPVLEALKQRFPPPIYRIKMQKLRFIAATLAAALCALALSVGAALAEEQHAPAGKPGAAKTESSKKPGGLFCPLKDLVH